MTKRILGALAALLLASAPVLAGGSAIAPPGAGATSVTMGGDVTGLSGATTVAKILGNTPGGACPAGQFAAGLDGSARPSCAAPAGTTSGFGLGSVTLKSGRFYPFFGEAYITGAAFTSTAVAKCHAVVVARAITATGLAGSVSTGSSGGNYQLALYNASADATAATTLIGTTASMTTVNPVGTQSAFTNAATPTLQPNTPYVVCGQVDNTSAVLASTGVSAAQISGFGNVSTFFPKGFNIGYEGFSYPVSAYGTWPADFTGTTATEINLGGVPSAVLVAQ